ncbi:MAG TPA: cytosine deaminase, partial [Candidatus Sericytochromatia bacterium]
MIPVSDRYWLRNAHIPQPLLDQSQPTLTEGTQDLRFTHLEPSDFLRVDLKIDNGTIAAIAPA